MPIPDMRARFLENDVQVNAVGRSSSTLPAST